MLNILQIVIMIIQIDLDTSHIISHHLTSSHIISHHHALSHLKSLRYGFPMCPSPGTTALSGRWSCLRRSPRGRGPAAAADAVPCGAARAPRPWPKSAAEPTATTARRRCEGRTGKTGPQTVSCQALSDCHVDIRQLCQWMSTDVNARQWQMSGDGMSTNYKFFSGR